MDNNTQEDTGWEKKKWPQHKDYLNKTFLEHLAHKMWVTIGTRFASNYRLLRKHELSNTSIAMLSAYLIILSLVQVYNLSISILIHPNLLAFSLTTLSILLLVFTQIENANDYKTKADSFLNCALEVSKLHEQVRIFKTMGEKSKAEKEAFTKEMSRMYNEALSKYPNHIPNDYDTFRCQHKDYFAIDQEFIKKTKKEYRIKTLLLYKLLIYLPPLIIGTLVILVS